MRETRTMKAELLNLMMERIRKTDEEIDKREDVNDKCMLLREMDGMIRTALNTLWEEERAQTPVAVDPAP